jgi:hypothetical protein
MITACVICGKQIEIVLGLHICDLCARYADKVEEARALAGSPYETAVKQEIRLPEDWHE